MLRSSESISDGASSGLRGGRDEAYLRIVEGGMPMHPNENVLREADKAQMAGNIEGFLSYFADDIVANIPGKSSLAGVYKGKDQFMDVFRRFNERTPEYSFEPHAYFADDEHGIILQRSHYKRGNEALDTNDTFVCHFRDGKIAEMWLSSDDPYAVDAFLG
jgi:ketosteroid isomerase-like protein